MWTFAVLFGSVILSGYLWLRSKYQIWKKQGVPHPPVNLLFGNMLDNVRVTKNLGQIYRDVYNNYKDLRYVGFYRMRTPSLIIRDPELIKNVLVKDFPSFHDNDFEVDEKMDPMFGKNPFAVKGEKWKSTRNQVTPCFTSGKMKAIFPVMQDVAKKFVDYLEKEQKEAGSEGLDAKEVCSKFTTENVINCSLGIEANCFKDPDCEFRQMGRKIFDLSFLGGMKMMLSFIFPKTAVFFDIKIIPDVVANYFSDTIKQVLKYREENKIKRNDFLENLLEVRAKDPSFDHVDLTAHTIGLFVDGFETSSIALSYVLYSLAANPDAQNRLKHEIDQVISKGDVTYEAVHSMAYLDAVMNESLRLHPPAPFMMRRCTQPYKLPPADGSEGRDVNVPVGTVMMIPLIGLHYDEKYFPEPEKFDPNRFLDSNKQDITKFTFLAFGEGPRICLGQRFGVAQVKVALFNVINNFEVKVNKRTKQPLEIDQNYFLMAAKGGLWLNFCKRQ